MDNLACIAEGINYLTAADCSPHLGSSNSLRSTTSGSSNATGHDSGNEASPRTDDNDNVFAAPSDTIEFHRTPLSTKARPFISNKGFSPTWKPHSTMGWGGIQPYYSLSRQDAFASWWSGPRGQVADALPYNEQDQEDMYTEYHEAPSSNYCETLQEDLYLSKDPEPEESLCLKEESPKEEKIEVSSNDDKPTKSKKNKQPKPEQTGEKVQRATSTITAFLEPLPVKHTFIHYADSNDGEEIAFKKKSSVRSRSAPRTPTGIIEQCGVDFSRGMAKLHLSGSCQPCAYFHNKQDGCRWGVDCKFCHLCPADEIKKRKKQKIKALKEKYEKLQAEQKENEDDVSTADNSGVENETTSSQKETCAKKNVGSD